MERTDEKKKVVIERGPSSKPYAKIILPEKRNRSEDRRNLNTYIADDRRSGIEDRRKRQ